jgi:two-component system response regulator TctD
MAAMRILLADDESELASWLVRAMAQSGFVVDWVADGRMVLPALAQTRYDALILDLGLPGQDGSDVLAALRQADVRLPVLVLTARDTLVQRVSTLHAGADDFLAKPFEIAEVEARLVALIRRARGSDHPRFACGGLAYDSATRQFVLDGEALSLSPREHAVLRALIQRSGEPLSKREVLERVFADDQDVHPEAIEVLVHRLRKRLEHKSVRVVTVRGLGYLLEAVGQP